MLTESIKEHFSQLQKQYDDLLAVSSLLPEQFQTARVDKTFFRDIKFDIPYDLAELRKTRRLLGKGWKFRQTWGSASPSYSYRNYAYAHRDFPDIDFEIHMDLSEPGSTCRLEEDGEEVKKVYKIICS